MRSVLKGITWRSVADISQLVLQIAFTAVLARILTKEDFGLISMALLFTRFIRSITQIGFGSAIIQSREVTNPQVSAVFVFNLVFNIVLALICIIVAPLGASFFHELKLIPLIRTIAWVLVINSLGFPQIILTKNMKFAGYSVLEVFSMILANCFAIYLAITGYGVWSLAFRLLIQRALFSFGIWFISDWRPSKPSFIGCWKLFRFGIHMLGSNVLNFFSQNIAAIVIGKYVGAETLGSFSIAYNLAVVPAQKIQTILTTVMMPAFSQIKAQIDVFKKKYFESCLSLGLFFIPMMLGVSAISHSLVKVVYGEKWSDAGTFLSLLAFVGLFKGMEHLLRSVIIANGWSHVVFRVTLLEMLVGLPLLYLGLLMFDILGLLVAYLLASAFSLTLSVFFSQKAVGNSSIFLKATIRSFIAAIVMFISIKGLSLIINFNVTSSLIAQIVFGILIYSTLRLFLISSTERSFFHSIPILNTFFAAR